MLEYFNKLLPEEINKFEKFVNSPYHNNNKNIIKLFKYLKTKHPEISENNSNRKKIFRYIYRVGKYNDATLRKLKSEFTKVFDNFLIQCEIEKYPIRKAILLLKSLKEKELHKHYDLNIKKTEKTLAENKRKDDFYYLYSTIYNTELLYYRFNKQVIIDRSLLEKRFKDLDYFFVYFKLDSFLDFAITQHSLHKKISFSKLRTFNFIKSFMKENISEIKKSHPKIYIKYTGLMMLRDLDNNKNLNFTHIDELEKYLKKTNKFFEKEITEYCSTVIESFYMKITKKDPFNLNYAGRLNKFYQYIFNQKLNDYQIYPATYLKAVNTGLLLREYSWVDNFIGKYKGKLVPKVIESSLYNLCRAKYYFELKNYMKSINYADRISMAYYYYNYASKYLYCQIYYETEDFFKLRIEIDNLKKFLKRKSEKLNTVLREEISIFIKYITLILRLKESNSSDKKFKADMFKSELKKEMNLPPNVYWLYQKLNEFK